MAISPIDRYFFKPEAPSTLKSKDEAAALKVHWDKIAPLEIEFPQKKISISHLQKLQSDQSSKIENLMDKLREEESAFQAIEKATDARTSLISYTEWVEEHLKEGIEFIESVLPLKILENPSYGLSHERISANELSCVTLLEALNFGLNGLSLIYRRKILNEAEDLLKEIKKRYEHEPLPDEVVKWEIQIKIQNEALNEKLLHYGVKGSEQVISFIQLPIQFFSKLIPHSDMILNVLGPAGAALGFIVSGLELREKKKLSKTHQEWMKQYQNWEKQIQPQVDMTKRKWGQKPIQALKHIEQTSKNLLQKREARTELKMMKLRANHEEYIPKLRELIKSPQGAQLLNQKLFPEFTQKFDKFFKKAVYGSFEEIAADFKKMGLSLPSKVKTKQDAINHLSNLRNHSAEFGLLFKQWLYAGPRETLLKAYVDHQDTIALTAKNALREMVHKRQSLIDKFLSFQLFSSKAVFGLMVAGAVMSALLGFMILMSWPVSIPMAILLVLSLSTTCSGTGLMLSGYYLSYKYKQVTLNPKTHLEQISLAFQNLRLGLAKFNRISTQKKLIETQKLLKQLRRKKDESAYQKALLQYKNVKSEFEESQRKIKEWSKKVNSLANHLKAKMWKDYAKFANLAINEDRELKGYKAFDTLHALTNALNACDLSLLDAETESFLQVQLGFDLKQLQNQMEVDPDAIKNALLTFFTLDETTFDTFIETQKLRLETGLIK